MMNRRTFATSLATVAAGATLSMATPRRQPRLLRPALLRPGDQVGLITPASFIEDAPLQKAVTNLESLGLKPVLGRNIREVNGSLAGADAQRLADLHAMFADPAIRGIWCARGGYGVSRLLPSIDYRLIRNNPKTLIGYSDITALHCALLRHTGLVSFHGPVGSSTLTDYTRSHVVDVLFEGRYNLPIVRTELYADLAATDEAYRPATLRPGIAEGPLLGGNLTLLAALAGTPYLPNPDDCILFIEDIDERPYRIDRMLTTLRQAWDMRRLAGIAMGIFAGCNPPATGRSLTLLQTLQ